MNHIYIRRLASALAVLAAALATVIASAPAAFARADPPRGPWAHPRHPLPFPPHTHAAAAGGMASGQVALILVGLAVLGAAAAVFILRARAARHRLPAAAA